MPVGKEKALKILDPRNKTAEEDYSLEHIDQAKRLGMRAIEKTIEKAPVPKMVDLITVNGHVVTRRLPHCPACGSPFYMKDVYGQPMNCCGNCGQALDWSDYDHIKRARPK